jgi:hypothetical protein
MASKPHQRADDIGDIANIHGCSLFFIADDTGIATPTKGSEDSEHGPVGSTVHGAPPGRQLRMV